MKGNEMFMFRSIRVFSIYATFATAMMLLSLVNANSVQAANLGQCLGSTRQSVVRCCQLAIAGHRPAWMIENHSSCKQSVICGGKAGARKCRVVQLDNQLTKGKSDTGKSISDLRLKTHINRVGTTVLDLPLYSFQYRGQTGTYIGVMAQDVLKVAPSAVSVGSNGYYEVDYSKLGIEMLQVH